VTILLASGKVDADEKDEEDRTPLSYAAQNYCTEVVTILLASEKVDAGEKDEEGRTSLSYAAQNYCTEVVTICLRLEKSTLSRMIIMGGRHCLMLSGDSFVHIKFSIRKKRRLWSYLLLQTISI
jgi:ankyrin repeat protein